MDLFFVSFPPQGGLGWGGWDLFSLVSLEIKISWYKHFCCFQNALGPADGNPQYNHDVQAQLDGFGGYTAY